MLNSQTTKPFLKVMMLLMLPLFVEFFTMIPLGNATTYYVATTGNNGNSCALAQNPNTPRQTIPAGILCLSSGDTLEVKAGIYPGQQITDPPAGSASAPTIIKNFPGDRPKITLRNQFDRGLYLTKGAASSYIEVRGFEFEGTYDGVMVFGNDSIGYPHHLRFIDNKVHHTVNTGMLLSCMPNGTAGGDHLIQGNEFYQIGSGTPGYHGMNTIYNPCNRTIVEKNMFHNSVNGVAIYTGGDFIYDVTIRNNSFYDMFRSDVDTWQRGANGGAAILVTGPGGRHKIYNNIIYRSGSESSFAGIAVYYGPQNDVKIYNNTVSNLLNPSARGISIEGGTSTNIHVKNNIVYQAGGIVGGTSVSNNVTTNPSFMNATSGDFRLQPGSDAVDKGVQLAEVPDDFVGVRRPQGTGYDLGAYEQSAGGIDIQPPATPTNLRIE